MSLVNNHCKNTADETAEKQRHGQRDDGRRVHRQGDVGRPHDHVKMPFRFEGLNRR